MTKYEVFKNRGRDSIRTASVHILSLSFPLSVLHLFIAEPAEIPVEKQDSYRTQRNQHQASDSDRIDQTHHASVRQ